jgi:hypothetical protein
MTVRARKEIRLPAMRNNIRHRRMSARMPLRGRESIDGLKQRESRPAVGDAIQPRAIDDPGILWAAGESPWRYIGWLLEDGKSDRKDGDDYRQ